MGLFPINGSTIGKALAVTPNNAIDARSAWLFENQTGTLGTNLNSSVLYVGVTGNVNCILSGVVGVQGTVTALDAADPYGANPSKHYMKDLLHKDLQHLKLLQFLELLQHLKVYS